MLVCACTNCGLLMCPTPYLLFLIACDLLNDSIFLVAPLTIMNEFFIRSLVGLTKLTATSGRSEYGLKVLFPFFLPVDLSLEVFLRLIVVTVLHLFNWGNSVLLSPFLSDDSESTLDNVLYWFFNPGDFWNQAVALLPPKD